ncbi:hypothetical protein IV102_13350 [bacterium]|nr:hypothetical protein [bacterium]
MIRNVSEVAPLANGSLPLATPHRRHQRARITHTLPRPQGPGRGQERPSGYGDQAYGIKEKDQLTMVTGDSIKRLSMDQIRQLESYQSAMHNP